MMGHRTKRKHLTRRLAAFARGFFPSVAWLRRYGLFEPGPPHYPLCLFGSGGKYRQPFCGEGKR